MDRFTCTKCGVEKPRSEFSVRNDSWSKKGVYSYCKACGNKKSREWHAANAERRRLYERRRDLGRKGLTLEAYDALVEAQGGVCAVCGTDNPGHGVGPGYGNWYVDHDHVSGRVRGLLCNTCNRGIGLLRDNPETLRRAAAYIEEAARDVPVSEQPGMGAGLA